MTIRPSIAVAILVFVLLGSAFAADTVEIAPYQKARVDSLGGVTTASSLVAWLAREYRLVADFDISAYQGRVPINATLKFSTTYFSSYGNVVDIDRVPSDLRVDSADFGSAPLAPVARGLYNQSAHEVDVTSLVADALPTATPNPGYAPWGSGIQFRWSDSDTVPNGCGYNVSNIKLRLVLAPAENTGTISNAKIQADGSPVDCFGVVSAMLGSSFYIEESDRSSGTRVDSSDAGRQLGERVWVSGIVRTLGSGERYITDSPITGRVGLSEPIEPFAMNYRALGGSDFGTPPLGQVGAPDGVGLNNVGLLVRASGFVTESGGDWMKIADGSGSGLKVIGALPAQSGLVTVTGISSLENSVPGTETPVSYAVTDLSTAIARAGTSQVTLTISQVVSVLTDTVVPENVTLLFSRGGMLEVAAGVTLTINGGIDAGLYQIFSGLGTVTGDPKVEAVYPEWFYSGAYDSQSANWSPAINKAVALANGGCLKVKLQSRRYNLFSAVNLASFPAGKAGMTLEGSVRSTQPERGTLLVGNTGSGRCVVETTDSDGIHLKNIGVVRGSVNPSTIGILQARGTGNGWAGDQFHENVYVNMGSAPAANGGLGTIGIASLGARQTRWQNLQSGANLPLVVSSSITCSRTRGDFSGTQECTISSSVGATLDGGAGGGVIRLSGLGRLTAYDYVSPCALISGAATVDLGETSLRMVESGTGGVQVGAYNYSIESWGCSQFHHYGSVDGAGGYLLNRRHLSDAQVNATMKACGETSAPVLYFFDDGASHEVSGCRFNIASGDVSRAFLASRRMDSSSEEPMLFAIKGCEFKTNLPLNLTTWPDSRVLRNTSSSVLHFGDGQRVKVGDRTVELPVSKNIGVRGQTTDLFRIIMPTCVSNLGAFSVSVSLAGSLSNAIDGGVGSPSVNSFRSKFSVANTHNAQNIVVSPIATTADLSANTDSGANLISGVVITAVADNANNYVTISARPTTAGSDNAPVLLRATLKLVWSGGYRDTIMVESL